MSYYDEYQDEDDGPFKLAAPDGTDQKVVEAFATAAKDADLSQAQAQQLLDEMAPILAKRQQDQISSVKQGWRDASTADQEYGGKDLKNNLVFARKALDKFDPLPKGGKTTALRSLLEDLGDHPEILRFLIRVGKTVGGAASGNANTSQFLSVLYDNAHNTETE